MTFFLEESKKWAMCMKHAWNIWHGEQSIFSRAFLVPLSKWMFCGFQECQNEPINSLVFLRVVVASQAEVWCVTIILTCTSHATCPSWVCVCVLTIMVSYVAKPLFSILTFYYCDVFCVVFLWQQWNPTFESGSVCICRAGSLYSVPFMHRGHTHSKTTLLRWYTRYPKHTNPLKWWQLKEHLFQLLLSVSAEQVVVIM